MATLALVASQSLAFAQPVAATRQLEDIDFDITRTFALLNAMLILPVLLALSVVSLSLGAIV